MKAISIAFFMCCLFITMPFSALAASDQQTHADIVLVNGSIYTMDASRRWAQAIAIYNGRIAFVGTDQDAVKFAGPLSNVVNLRGKLVLPGFIDSHIHPIDGALEEAGCYLNDFENLDSIKRAIKDFAKEHPEDKWISGSGWALPTFGPGGPNKKLLDELVPDRPAYIVSQDGHSGWANSKALELAGVNSFTPDPPGGRIERSGAGKDPTGCLRETACELVSKLVPKPSSDQYRDAALKVQKKLNAFGIVAVQDACVGEEELKAYASLDDSNLLTMRVSTAMMLNADKGEAQINKFKEWRDKYDGDTLSVRAVKIFSDGVIETKTAALLEPYLDPGSEKAGGSKAAAEKTSVPASNNADTKATPAESVTSKDAGAEADSNRGILEFAPNLFKWYACKIDEAGFQIHVHAIGDRAVRTALDAIETAQKINGRSDKRHHIAHLELIHANDMNRFREQNIAANFQSFWAFRDKYVSELTEPILGPERCKHLYPINSIFKTGALVVGGSDWTVTTANPLDAIQVAVTRCGLDENPDKVFLPEERVSLPEILAAYTINGAYLGHWEKETGSLEVGKSADLVILDKNLFAINPKEIHNTKVLWTLFKGRAVYRDPNFEI